MVYKIVHNRTPITPSTIFDFSQRDSRRHNFQLKSKYFSPKKQNSFSNRIVNTWNILDRETEMQKTPTFSKENFVGNLKIGY